MSFNATFKFDGGPAEGLQVISCAYGFGQSRDDKGRPNSTVVCADIGVRIIQTENSALESWMLDPYEQRNGRIIFSRADSPATFKELVFEKAYCVAMEGGFIATGNTKDTSFANEFYLSAQVIIADGCRQENNW